jgi:cbb3-type cytochrome oxidase subunit 1
MKNIGTLFIATAALFASFGMLWGIQMSMAHDHGLSPAHAHLNLVGWATMAIFGLYYTITPQAAGRLAQVHYVLHTIAVLIFAPGIAMAIRENGEGMAAIGALLVVLSMIIFLVNVVRTGFGRQAV